MEAGTAEVSNLRVEWKGMLAQHGRVTVQGLVRKEHVKIVKKEVCNIKLIVTTVELNHKIPSISRYLALRPVGGQLKVSISRA